MAGRRGGGIGKPRQRLKHRHREEWLLDLLCPEASPLALCLSAQSKSSSAEVLLDQQLPRLLALEPESSSPLPPKCNNARVIKRKDPRQEALGNTIRKEYESTYKTVLAVYLTTSEHPARRNTVISFPYSALPLLFLFNSLVTIAMQEKSHQHCLNYSVWLLLSRSLVQPSLILHKALSPSWVPTTTPNAPLASAPQHNLIVMQDHS